MEFLFPSLFTDQVFRYFWLAFTCIALTVWVLTLITDNHSWMDKLWPLLPMFYSWALVYTALNSNLNESSLLRIKVMAFLVSIWGVRLAYIFYRRGYYKPSFEDHRWELVKKKYNYPQKKLAFHIFNFVFMAIVQNLILLGYTLPLWFVQKHVQSSFNTLDIVMTILFFFFYSIEAVADEQQWNFQTKKYEWLAEQKSGVVKSKFTNEQIEDFKRGFLVKGLFKYSRHPNYFGDICLWFCIYGFSLSAQLENFNLFSLINYSIFSALLMTYLFKRSVAVTENISAKKYPEYSDYKAKVRCILPTLSGYVSKKN